MRALHILDHSLPSHSGYTFRTRALLQGQKRQFVGHARGARHLGAGRDELREAVVTALAGEPDEEQRAAPWLELLR